MGEEECPSSQDENAENSQLFKKKKHHYQKRVHRYTKRVLDAMGNSKTSTKVLTAKKQNKAQQYWVLKVPHDRACNMDKNKKLQRESAIEAKKSSMSYQMLEP